MKQTAVDWLIEQIWKREPLEHEQKVIEEAKAKERNQAQRDFLEGYKYGLKPMNHDVLDKFLNQNYKTDNQ